jgi:hypothetical protein
MRVARSSGSRSANAARSPPPEPVHARRIGRTSGHADVLAAGDRPWPRHRARDGRQRRQRARDGFGVVVDRGRESTTSMQGRADAGWQHRPIAQPLSDPHRPRCQTRRDQHAPDKPQVQATSAQRPLPLPELHRRVRTSARMSVARDDRTGLEARDRPQLGCSRVGPAPQRVSIAAHDELDWQTHMTGNTSIVLARPHVMAFSRRGTMRCAGRRRRDASRSAARRWP